MSNKEIQNHIDVTSILKNKVQLDSWLEELQQSILNNTIVLEEKYSNYYLSCLRNIFYFNHYGKVFELKKTINNLIDYLSKRKKINRIEELKLIIQKYNIQLSTDIQNIINELSGSKICDMKYLRSSISVMNNLEVFIDSKEYREQLAKTVDLLDPLQFIEALYKCIEKFFESDGHQKIIFNYVRTTHDNELIDAANLYLAGRYEEIKSKLAVDNTEEILEHKYVQFEKHIHSDDEDYLLNIATLREKLVEGCKSKQEYVNTLFEIAKNYKRLGQHDRALFFAMIVHRLSPDYRNVGAMFKI